MSLNEIDATREFIQDELKESPLRFTLSRETALFFQPPLFCDIMPSDDDS
jgi:hypothetical protein